MSLAEAIEVISEPSMRTVIKNLTPVTEVMEAWSSAVVRRNSVVQAEVKTNFKHTSVEGFTAACVLRPGSNNESFCAIQEVDSVNQQTGEPVKGYVVVSFTLADEISPAP